VAADGIGGDQRGVERHRRDGAAELGQHHAEIDEVASAASRFLGQGDAEQVARRELAPEVGVESHVVLVDAGVAGVQVIPVPTTSGQPHADVALDGAAVPDADVLVIDDGTALAGLIDRAVIALCAIECGVADAALHLAARYTTEREQFGRPIGSFQAVQQRMADGFIDAQSIRWTMFYAAWLLDEGRPATRDAAMAKFWASEAGARIAATTQQVHGGMGIDITYPLHRYTLWAKQLELTLGAAPAQLARLGATYLEETA
jgi:alkylation response protein AidB-like acyl-CoA dehydrogenase